MAIHLGGAPQIGNQSVLHRDHLVVVGQRVAPELKNQLVTHVTANDELTDSRIPVVFYDVGTPRQNINNIRVDYRRGIDKVIDYLHSLGHRNVGFVGHHSLLVPVHERERAVVDAAARYPRMEVRTASDADTLDRGAPRTGPGHGSPTVTLGVYGHLFTNTDDRTAEIIESPFTRVKTE